MRRKKSIMLAVLLLAVGFASVSTVLYINGTVSEPQWIDKGQYQLLKAEGNTSNEAETSDEIAIGDEHFYVISNDGTTLKALAKYNLLVGNEVDGNSWDVTPLATTTGIQSSTAKGYVDGDAKFIGTVPFSNSSDRTWNVGENGIEAKATGTLHDALANYKATLPEGTKVRLITKTELERLGCDSSKWTCSGAPAWVYSTTYWSGSANAEFADFVWNVYSNGVFHIYNFNTPSFIGVRPVISFES